MRIATNFTDVSKMQGLTGKYTLTAQELTSYGNFFGVMLRELEQAGEVAEQQQTQAHA